MLGSFLAVLFICATSSLMVRAQALFEDPEKLSSDKTNQSFGLGQTNDSPNVENLERGQNSLYSSLNPGLSPLNTHQGMVAGNRNPSSLQIPNGNDIISGVYSNGNSCVFQNGMITENGVTRQATPDEIAQLQNYLIQMERYNELQFREMNNRMRSQMSRIFSPGFPFNNQQQQNIAPVIRPDIQSEITQMPKPPCLCKSNCNNLSNFNGGLL